jgi:predicted ATP-dependent endonuclease of OLD family
MKLTEVDITDFQCIRKSNFIQVSDITCLVGKNESGKTALLQALYRLNPIIPEHGKYDVTDDYPRADVEDYNQAVESGEVSPTIVAKATFSLAEEEIQPIEGELGKHILNTPELTLSKGYNNQLYISLNTNERIAVDAVLSEAQLPTDLARYLSSACTLSALNESYQQRTDPGEQEHLNRLKAILDRINQGGGLASYIYKTHLEKLVPKFLYFDEFFLMTGFENIEALISREKSNTLKKSDYALLGLIALARIGLDQLLNPQRTQWLINKLEGASNHLSKKILKYWSQNKHLLMRFDVRPARPGDPENMRAGTNILAQVYDTKRMVSTVLGTRSKGFVWFFSFLSWFDQQQHKGVPLILLLDEPGLFLHGRAQADLLRYIDDEVKNTHQVIYTTHSPFMVDPAKFERVRIVQDKSMDIDEPLAADQDGTKIITEVLEATEDSLFPLQGALGYDISQTLFVGPNSLVVEGVSDLLYLQTMSAVLSSLGRISLSAKWTITPVGGAEKVPTFVALLGAQRRMNVATLLDIQKKDQQTIENLYKRKLLKKQNVHTYADFTSSSEADIEDMFTVNFYLKLINMEYSSDLSGPIQPSQLKSGAPRILVRLEKFFIQNPLNNAAQFNHYRPARYFVENVAQLTNEIPSETLDRFEAVFNALNALL